MSPAIVAMVCVTGLFGLGAWLGLSFDARERKKAKAERERRRRQWEHL